ncbi:MAG: hypothetical protein LUB59_03370 [Candidatus Gastranaerophilales bacterium]|nr:hypothetical protein [Candidatus Gastranaerophilales bacterium]
MPFNVSIPNTKISASMPQQTCQVDCLRVSTPILEYNLTIGDEYLNKDNTPIGDIYPVPESVIYRPAGVLANFYIKNFSQVYKSVDNIGINKKNARQVDICLAKYSKAVADEINTVGACYTGVKYSFLSSGIINDYGEMPKGSAHNSLSYFDNNPEKFKRVNVRNEDLKNLPAGYIIVYTKEGTDGHIAITNGNGQEMSDCTDNMEWLKKHGQGSQAFVYKLTDNWQYDCETKKLKFTPPQNDE